MKRTLLLLLALTCTFGLFAGLGILGHIGPQGLHDRDGKENRLGFGAGARS